MKFDNDPKCAMQPCAYPDCACDVSPPTPLREEKRELADYLHQRAYVLECCDTTNDNAEARKLRRWIVMLADLQPVQNAPRGDEDMTRPLDEYEEPLRELCFDYRNAHTLHAENYFQRIVRWVRQQEARRVHSSTAHGPVAWISPMGLEMLKDPRGNPLASVAHASRDIYTVPLYTRPEAGNG